MQRIGKFLHGLILRNSNRRTSALHDIYYDIWDSRGAHCSFPSGHLEKCLCLPALEIRPISSLVFTLVLTKYLAQKWALRKCSLYFQRSPSLSHKSKCLVLVLLTDVLIEVLHSQIGVKQETVINVERTLKPFWWCHLWKIREHETGMFWNRTTFAVSQASCLLLQE